MSKYNNNQGTKLKFNLVKIKSSKEEWILSIGKKIDEIMCKSKSLTLSI
jgi:hypothetical protein